MVGSPGLIPGAEFTPASPGEFVSLFLTGLGPTDPPLEAGEIPAQRFPGSNGQARVTNEISVTIGGIAVSPEDIFYAGVAPCCAGLYQLVIRIPLNAPDGDLTVIVTVKGVSSPEGPFVTVKRQ